MDAGDIVKVTFKVSDNGTHSPVVTSSPKPGTTAKPTTSPSNGCKHEGFIADSYSPCDGTYHYAHGECSDCDETLTLKEKHDAPNWDPDFEEVTYKRIDDTYHWAQFECYSCEETGYIKKKHVIDKDLPVVEKRATYSTKGVVHYNGRVKYWYRA